MDDEIIYDWEKPAPPPAAHTSVSEALSAEEIPIPTEGSEPEKVQPRYSNGYIKSDDFMKDLWDMPGNEFLIVRESLPEGVPITEETALPILENHWREVAAGNNPFEREIRTGFEEFNAGQDAGENIGLHGSEESELIKSRVRISGMEGEGIERLLREQGETIKRGLDAREEELALQEAELRALLEEEGLSKTQPTGRSSLIGAALHLFKSSPKSATRADLHRIAIQKQSLNASRQNIMAAHELFVTDTLICDQAVNSLNGTMQHTSSDKLGKFLSSASELAAADGVSNGHIFGRVNDPMDTDERLQPMRDIQRELNTDPMFMEDAQKLTAASARATRASRLVADLLNNEGLMSAESFKAVSVAAENVSDKIGTTEFPVEKANVHPENSHLKDSVKQFAEISQKIAEAIIAAIRGLASGLRGPAAEAEGPSAGI